MTGLNTSGLTWFSATYDSNGTNYGLGGYYAYLVSGTTNTQVWVPPTYNSSGQQTGGGYYETVSTPYSYWQEVYPTTHNVQVPYHYWVEVYPATHQVSTPYLYWVEVYPTTHSIQIPYTYWQEVYPTTHTVQVSAGYWQEVPPVTYTTQEAEDCWYTVQSHVEYDTETIQVSADVAWAYATYGPAYTLSTDTDTSTASTDSGPVTQPAVTTTSTPTTQYEDETITNVLSTYMMDAMGRVTDYKQFKNGLGTLTLGHLDYERTASYDNASNVTTDTELRGHNT